MRDKRLEKRMSESRISGQKHGLSPLEMMKVHGGRAHRVGGMAGRGADAMIAVYKDRFTYTFVMSKEVASIHFDAKSNKIFFSGHNIHNMNLSEKQKNELLNVIKILENDPDGKKLKEAYQATLTHHLADK